MEVKTLIKANLKRNKESLTCIFILVFIVSIAMNVVLTLWANSESYIKTEMDRLGYGTVTAWVSRLSNSNDLEEEIESLEAIDHVETQRLIYSNYTVNNQESDSEGQLIPLADMNYSYKFFTDDLRGYQETRVSIEPGTVYVSPALVSMLDVQINDEITFPIARQGQTITLTIKGFYEDPWMGSSMIGMKGFLINEEDYFSIVETIKTNGIEALVREGAMVHIFAETDSKFSVSELSNQLNTHTSLPRYMEFMHSQSAIADFMLVLQKAFGGLLAAFVLVLLLVVIIVIRSSMDRSIEADYVNMGILKTLGFTSKKLRQIHIIQYLFVIFTGMLIGLIFIRPMNATMSQMTLTTTGFLIPTKIPILAALFLFAFILSLLILFIILKTAKIGKISPLIAMRGESEEVWIHPKSLSIHGNGLTMRLAIRSLTSGARKYLAAWMIAVLLVFFVSLVGRMDSWLGDDGQGMMDAFNPADHDIGVQRLGDVTQAETESMIQAYSNIIDSYLLAMPTVAVNGTSYTANVISETARFHLISGSTCVNENEVVLTQIVADDLGVSIGSTVNVASGENSEDYLVTGIYQCANEMGGNIGMSREGYLKIGRDDAHLWCTHYFLDDPSQKTTITEALGATYGGDVHVHENSWPGLIGIISAMQALVILMVVLSGVFILIVTIMTAEKYLSSEQKDLAIYKIIGFNSGRLRLTFALRFGLMATLGSLVGTILAALIGDPLVATIMKLCGISHYVSNPSLVTILLPAMTVITFFMGFAYQASARIKKLSITHLLQD